MQSVPRASSRFSQHLQVQRRVIGSSKKEADDDEEFETLGGLFVRTPEDKVDRVKSKPHLWTGTILLALEYNEGNPLLAAVSQRQSATM